MGRADQASSIFWIILVFAVVYGSYLLGLGTLTHPGPRFLTFWCGIILAALSVPVFIQRNKTRQARGEAKLEKQWMESRWAKSAHVVLAILAYSLAFTHLGFLLSTTLLLIFLFKAGEQEKWMITIGDPVFASFIYSHGRAPGYGYWLPFAALAGSGFPMFLRSSNWVINSTWNPLCPRRPERDSQTNHGEAGQQLQKSAASPKFLEVMDRLYVPVDYRSNEEYQKMIETGYKEMEDLIMELSLHKS